MKRAIAMRCNQKQFDTIKGKLVGCSFNNITDFNLNNYLTNNWSNDYKSLANHSFEHSNIVFCVVRETWNEQVFLEACGIETEKIFKAGELEFINYNGEWADTTGKYRVKIKTDYSKEIAELERQIQILKNK